MSTTTTGAASAGLPFDPSTLPLETQMEVGAKLAFGPAPFKNFAPYILGMWFDAILLGCFIILFSKWVRYAYRTERPVIKVLMFYLLIVSFTISGYILAYSLYLFAAGFGEWRRFLNVNWSRVFYTLNGFSRIPAAAFFSHRAWMISGKSIFIPILITPLLLGSMACAICATEASTSLPINDREHAFVISFLCTEVAVDLINTLTIAIGLYRSRTGWKSTDRLISRLLVIVAETQLPPTLVAIAFLVCFLGWPNTTGIALFTAAAKVHVVCLVVVLNSRIKMKSEYMTGNSGDNTYHMNSRPTVTIDTYTHQDPGQEKISRPAHSNVDQSGVVRTVNGRPMGLDQNDFYKESDSKSSLV